MSLQFSNVIHRLPFSFATEEFTIFMYSSINYVEVYKSANVLHAY